MTTEKVLVEDAIILAGGRGTRMLPANYYTPKECLPLIDTPLINHLIWEACKSEVKRIHVIISPNKRTVIRDKLNGQKNYQYENIRTDIPREILMMPPEEVEIIIHEQINPGGVGDAIKIALDDINGPFLVLLGDNLIMDFHPSLAESGPSSGSLASKKLVDYFERTGRACAGLIKVKDDQLNKYGVVEIRDDRIINIVEKPDLNNAPSNYILCGRYLLLQNTNELLDKFSVEEYGELQSIAMFQHLIKNEGFGGVKMNGFELYDSGDPISWLKSQILHALKRPDLSDEFQKWLGRIRE